MSRDFDRMVVREAAGPRSAGVETENNMTLNPGGTIKVFNLTFYLLALKSLQL